MGNSQRGSGDQVPEVLVAAPIPSTGMQLRFGLRSLSRNIILLINFAHLVSHAMDQEISEAERLESERQEAEKEARRLNRWETLNEEAAIIEPLCLGNLLIHSVRDVIVHVVDCLSRRCCCILILVDALRNPPVLMEMTQVHSPQGHLWCQVAS
jgi:hypothetical protein